jgi:RNA polymerase sigma factor (TIGR02999 family)
MERSDITALLRDWATGSPAAPEALMPLVYQDLKLISRRLLRRESRSELTTTALVHDLYLKLVRGDSVDLNDRRHFFSYCARLMRQILTDQARASLTGKRHATIESPLGLEELPWLGPSPVRFLDLNSALERLALVEPEKAQVVELRVYLGCTSQETAEILGIAKVTVDRHMAFAKAWLFQQLRA